MFMDLILSHGDVDGICSAALISRWRKDVKVFFSHPYGLLEDLKENIKNGPYDNIFILDISLNERDLNELLALFKQLGNVIYIDHHPLPLGIHIGDIRRVTSKFVYSQFACTSELVYRFLERRIPGDLSRVAIYGGIGDYMDTTPYMKELLRFWDKRSLYFEAGILINSLERKRGDYDFKRELVNYLRKNLLPSEWRLLVGLAIEEAKIEEKLRNWVKDNVKKVGNIAFVINPPGPLSRAAIFAKAVTRAPVGLAGVIRKKDKMIDMSLRANEIPMLDLNLILRKLSLKFGGSGGGHKYACGARIPAGKFEKFISSLDKEVSIWLE